MTCTTSPKLEKVSIRNSRVRLVIEDDGDGGPLTNPTSSHRGVGGDGDVDPDARPGNATACDTFVEIGVADGLAASDTRSV